MCSNNGSRYATHVAYSPAVLLLDVVYAVGFRDRLDALCVYMVLRRVIMFHEHSHTLLNAAKTLGRVVCNKQRARRQPQRSESRVYIQRV